MQFELWANWVQHQRGFWFVRGATHYGISRDLQKILHLRQHIIPITDYIRMMHPEDSGRVVSALERAGTYMPQHVVINDPVRIQSMPGVWIAFITVANLIHPPPDLVYLGLATRVRCD